MNEQLLNTGRNGNIVPRRQNEEEAEKTALQQQPVRLQPSWEENNLPEDELNFKNLTMDDASLQLHTPKDRLNLVYITFIIHGIGVLMPWNMFITAKLYFTDYKLGEEYTGSKLEYASVFLQYLTFASQVPNVVFNWLNIFMKIGGNLTTRIVWSISIEVILFVITVALAMCDSREWPGAFFWITMVTVVVLNMVNGIYQNTIFGMAAKLPGKYTGAVVLGSNISGTFTTVVSILSSLFSDNQRMSAIYYFITALFVLLVCFDTYFALPLNRFYRHYELKEQKEMQMQKASSGAGKIRVPYYYIFKKAFPQLLNIFMVFFVTLTLFPTVSSDIKRNDPDFFITDEYFTQITCFLTFNVCAMIGSFVAGYVQFPKARYLWIPVFLRLLYIPFYLVCNYNPIGQKRILPVYITNDWLYWITAITMGTTSGYLSSLGMMYAPRTVEDRHSGTAGMFAGAALITGIFTGILVAFVWPWFVTNVGF